MTWHSIAEAEAWIAQRLAQSAPAELEELDQEVGSILTRSQRANGLSMWEAIGIMRWFQARADRIRKRITKRTIP